MEKIKLTFALILLGTFLGSCKKDPEPLPEPSVGNPVFGFTATVDGQAINLQGGVNDYYMYASFSEDAGNVKSYTANLKTVDCASCPNSIRISFVDYKSSSPLATDPDSTFYVGNYNYANNTGNPSRYLVNFTSTTVGPVATGISWDFGDGTSKVELNPSHTYVRPGEYNVCMDAHFLGGATSSLCNSFHLGNHNNFVEVNLNAGNPVGTQINFSSLANSGTPPYTFLWNFGDGNTATDQNIIHNYASEGVYQVSVTARDSKGITDTENQNVRTQNSNAAVARFNYAVSGISNPGNLGNVIVEWTDANGLTYTSKNDSQPFNSAFKILSVEEYIANENGLPTKKIHVQFSCTLYNGASSILIENADAVISVAH